MNLRSIFTADLAWQPRARTRRSRTFDLKSAQPDAPEGLVAAVISRAWFELPALRGALAKERVSATFGVARLGILRCRAIVEDKAGVAIVSKYPEGVRVLRAMQPLPLEQGIAICETLVESVANCHQAGLVLGLVDEDQILVDPQGAAYIVDAVLGAAFLQAYREVGEAVADGLDFRHAAPEVVARQPMTPASDVYWLGSIMTMLLDTLPVSPMLRGIMQRATHAQASDRYADASAMMMALATARVQHAAGHAINEGPAPRVSLVHIEQPATADAEPADGWEVITRTDNAPWARWPTEPLEVVKAQPAPEQGGPAFVRSSSPAVVLSLASVDASQRNYDRRPRQQRWILLTAGLALVVGILAVAALRLG